MLTDPGFLLGDRFSLLPALLAAGILAWDIVLAGWIAAQRKASRPFTTLTGVCGFLVAPSVLVVIVSGIDIGARTIVGISWIWPVVLCCFTAQVCYALVARLISPVVGIPLLIYNLGVTAVALGDFLVSSTGHAPVWLQGAVAARDAIVGVFAGRAALVTPMAILVPMIAPAFPAKWKATAGIRALITLTATVVATLLVMEWPRGVGAVRSYDAARGVRLQERPKGDFALGLRMFPTLGRAPSARIARADMKIADTLGIKVVLVVLESGGTTAAALDSLSRVLEPLRADSARIAVALDLGRESEASQHAARLVAIDRILRRVRPDVLIPAFRSPLPSLFRTATPDADWWKHVLSSSAQVIQRVRPRTGLGWAATRVDVTDSVVYAWAVHSDSPVRVIGVVVFPSFAGLPAVDARLRAFERWHSASMLSAVQSGAAPQPVAHWLMETGGLPHAHGDASQTAAIMHSLAWATRRPWITAAIVGDAGDYHGGLGLRAVNGRIRPAVGAVARGAKALRESAAGR